MMEDTGEAGIVIVGAGECGLRAALALRELGYESAVTLIGAEAHLPYERPPLSKSVLLSEDEPALSPVTTLAELESARIDWQPSTEVLSIGLETKTILTTRHEVLPYDRLLIATGARPRKLAQAGDDPRFVTLRTFEDALTIRKAIAEKQSIAVIGGGFIGLEVAASARQLGCDVTVIEGQNRILMRGVPQTIAARIHDLHTHNGVRVLCGQAITGIDLAPRQVTLTLSVGETVTAGLVVVGIGAEPNVALATAAGLAVDNGIVVDADLRTSDAHVFAAGDCCSFPLALYGDRRVRLESWRNAIEQGRQAAQSMLGIVETGAKIPWFWSDQYDYSLQIAGLADQATQTIERLIGDEGILLFHLTDEGQLVAASGFGPGNSVARDIKIIERAILASCRPDPADLADPTFKLKSLLTS